MAPAVTVPSAPSGLTATAISSTEIDLTWTDNASNETGFQIQRSPDGSSWSNLTTVAANSTSYADTGLTAATTYFYRVSAFNGGGSSASSNVASASTVLLPFTDNFNSDTTGAVPAGWSQWESSSRTSFKVAASVTINGDSGLSSNDAAAGHAWYSTSVMPVDCEVDLTSLNLSTGGSPANWGACARAANLNGSTWSGYALLYSRNCQPVTLYRADAGVLTAIGGPLSSGTFVTSGSVIKLALRCNGTNIRGQVYAQTGPTAGKYLQPNGTWLTSQAWAFNVTDSTYNSPGYAGIIKTDTVRTANFIDDFAVVSAAGDTTPPVVALTAPNNGDTLTGSVTLSATATDTGGVTSVSWLVDGVSVGSDTTSPYSMTLNSISLSNGSHTIQASAIDLSGNIGFSSTITITASNDIAVTRPTTLAFQNYPSMKSFQLAYSGTTFDTASDLVVPDVDAGVISPSYMTHLRSLRSTGHYLFYTNIGNIYQDLLADWLNYADANAHDREDAFYHSAVAFAYSGPGTSAVSARKFWACQSGPVGGPYTGQRGGPITASGGTWPNTTGQIFEVGHIEKFREFNGASLTTAASGGWTAVLEYCTAVDGSGTPTTWATLTTLANTTAGLTTNGQITWFPPADWMPCFISGQNSFANSARFYYIRWRITGTGTAPVYGEIFGRDFSGSGYINTGTTPVFDDAADLNGDGFLDATEYATRGSDTNGVRKDAMFRYEGRLGTGYGDWRIATRTSQASVLAWATDYHQRVIAANPDYNGFFMDNSIGVPSFTAATARESVVNYATEYASCVNAIWRGLPDHATMGPRWVIMNVTNSSSQNYVDAVLLMLPYAPAWYGEFYLRPLTNSWSVVENYLSIWASFQATATPPPIGVVDSFADNTSPGRANPTNQYNALCYYYMAATAEMFLNFWGGEAPIEFWKNKWSPVAAYNIGTPSEVYNVWHTGTDPDTTIASNLVYKVYKRQFTNALVLWKPLSYTSPNTGELGSASQTTHDLTVLHSAGYKQVGTDASLGSVITSITLQNGQGAILIPQ